MRTSCIEKESLFSALWWPKWEANSKTQGLCTCICICICICICVCICICLCICIGRLQSMGSSAKSQTRLSDFTFTFHFHALEKEMTTHSSVLAWRIPGTGEPGGLPSLGLHRVRHYWSDLATAAACICIRIVGFPGGSVVKNVPDNAGDIDSIPGLGKIPWRRKWQPTPVFLPGKCHKQRSLEGYSPWSHRVRHDLATEHKYIYVYLYV